MSTLASPFVTTAPEEATVTERITAAAHRLLDAAGLEGVTIRAVLGESGINRRAFYERFADKDQLMLAVFAEAIQLVAAVCRTATAGVDDPMERLKFVVDYLVVGDRSTPSPGRASVRRHAALCREHMRLAESRPGDLKLALRPLIGLMAEQLAEGMARGAIRRDDPEALAGFVYNLVSTTVHAVMLAQEAGGAAADRDALAARMWAFCRRGVAP